MTTKSRLAARNPVPLARPLVLLVPLVLLATAWAPLAGAQGAALPEARAVLARYAEVTNAAKFATIAGTHFKGTFELPAAGLTGTMEGFSDQLGRSVHIVTLGGIGEIREGVDTAFAWSLDPMQGPKLIEGKEFVESREQEDPRAMRRDPAVVLDAQTTERATIDGESCVKLKLKWKSGRTTTECYSEKTGLLVSEDGVETSSMGDIATTTSYSEYKTFDGITMPTKRVKKVAGTEVTMRFAEVEFGAVDPAKLAIPPEIQALRKK
jgi:hypothetical protein